MGALARTPPGGGLHPWTPLRDFRHQTPNLPTPEKNLPSAHVIGPNQRFVLGALSAAAKRDPRWSAANVMHLGR